MKYSLTLAALLGLAAASQATLYDFVANLTGGQETPPNASAAYGNASIHIDTATGHVYGYVRWTGLDTTPGAQHTPTGSHIHVGVLGTAGDVIYNYGVANLTVDGIYMRKTFDMVMVNKTQANTGGTGYNGVLQTPAQQLANWFLTGHTYVNAHDPAFPGGEIRGQLAPVPEPASLAALGLGALALLRRRRR